MRPTIALASALVMFAFASSNPTSSFTLAAGPAAAAPELPTGLFLAEPPTDAKDIAASKPLLKPGDKVILIGRIGGSKEPFVEGRAIFTIMDKNIKACGEGTAMDSCKTPWDYCCEPREEITKNIATIQVVGDNGQPLKRGLDGVNGLKPLATVIVKGVVAQAAGGNLLVRAEGIHVVKKP